MGNLVFGPPRCLPCSLASGPWGTRCSPDTSWAALGPCRPSPARRLRFWFDRAGGGEETASVVVVPRSEMSGARRGGAHLVLAERAGRTSDATDQLETLVGFALALGDPPGFEWEFRVGLAVVGAPEDTFCILPWAMLDVKQQGQIPAVRSLQPAAAVRRRRTARRSPALSRDGLEERRSATHPGCPRRRRPDRGMRALLAGRGHRRDLPEAELPARACPPRAARPVGACDARFSVLLSRQSLQPPLPDVRARRELGVDSRDPRHRSARGAAGRGAAADDADGAGELAPRQPPLLGGD